MVEKLATRIAYGRALVEFGDNEKVYVFDSDLKKCTMTEYFAEKYSNRFFNVGIAEANMVGIGAGFATFGMIALVHTFAIFATGRVFDQIRNSVCYPGLNVKIIGSHAGLTVGEDGPTHQALEDIGIMRTLPGMIIVVPCDSIETRLATKAIIEKEGPCYLRTGRFPVENVVNQYKNYNFQIGKGVQLVYGKDVTIIACGIMVQEALKAQKKVLQEGIEVRVIDMHTIKPIDADIIIKAAVETGAIITVEEHNVYGGLGSAVSEIIVQNHPIPMEIMGVKDCFGHSGKPRELLIKYGLTVDKIVEKIHKIMIRKKNFE